MAEELLDVPEVRSPLKKVRRAGVPERMGVKTKGKPCRPPALSYHLVDGGRADAVAEATQKESLFLRVVEEDGSTGEAFQWEEAG